MRRFALVSPVFVCALISVLAAPVSAQYPGKDPNRKIKTPGAELTRLQSTAPGNSALVTMNDGTLRGGWVASVNDSHLNLEKQGVSTALALSDIAMVRVQRQDRTLLYGMFGYLVTGTAATIIAYHNGEHDFASLVIVGSVGGIPGGILGALMGSHYSGDIEIIP
jgi:hypothetical protein